MSEDKNRHVAAKISFEVNGMTYTISPMTIADFKELEEYLRCDAIRVVKKELDGLPEHIQSLLATKAYEDMQKIRIGTTDFDRAAMSPDGVGFMLFLQLRHNHADITRGEVDELITGGVVEDLQSKIMKAAGFRTDDGSKKKKQ